jgi:hypothetical protein
MPLTDVPPSAPRRDGTSAEGWPSGQPFRTRLHSTGDDFGFQHRKSAATNAGHGLAPHGCVGSYPQILIHRFGAGISKQIFSLVRIAENLQGLLVERRLFRSGRFSLGLGTRRRFTQRRQRPPFGRCPHTKMPRIQMQKSLLFVFFASLRSSLRLCVKLFECRVKRLQVHLSNEAVSCPRSWSSPWGARLRGNVRAGKTTGPLSIVRDRVTTVNPAPTTRSTRTVAHLSEKSSLISQDSRQNELQVVAG